MCETRRTFQTALPINHNELVHMSIIWRRRRMKQTPTVHTPMPGKSAKQSRAEAFVSDCALDGPSEAARQPSPRAEMIDRGKRSSRAMLNNPRPLQLLNKKTTNMHQRPTVRPIHALESCMQCIHPQYQPRVDRTGDFDELFFLNLEKLTCPRGSTTPHKVRTTCSAEEGRTKSPSATKMHSQSRHRQKSEPHHMASGGNQQLVR